MQHRIAFLVSFILLISGPVFAVSIELPKTGQTTSYSQGDDGALQRGISWPNPRFTDNGDGTVTDNLTGLMWIKDANLPTISMTWQEALDFVKSLNTGTGTYGYTDWRLPNRKELRSLIDHSEFSPALISGYPFVNIPELPSGSDYWTSTTFPYTLESAWYIDLYDGDVYADLKGTAHYVWPVRGTTSFLPRTNQGRCYNTIGDWISCTNTGQDASMLSGIPWPNPRYTDNGDGTQTDSLTGLMWLKDANCIATQYPNFDNDTVSGDGMITWQHALDFVAGINSGLYPHCAAGYNNWRLPNINELESLVNDDTVSAKSTATWLKAQGFINVQDTDYWSSTTDANSPSEAWRVFMRSGYENAQNKTLPAYHGFVWPVADSTISTPTNKLYYEYSSSAFAVKSTNPAWSKPIGVGSVATGGTTLSLEVSVGKFKEGVDVYFGIYASAVDPDNIYLLKSDNTFQTVSEGIVAWKTNKKDINERLFGSVSISNIPKGTYELYLAITPAGSTDSYYLWKTNFTIP